jgi:hypothetical protein
MAGRPVKIDEQGTPDVSVDSRQVGTADGVPVVRQIVSLGAGDAPDAIIDTTGGTVPVSGTVAVTGTQDDSLTDAQLRATAVPVSGTVAVTGTQDDSLTDTQLRATAVPVSGTVGVTGTQTDSLTDTELRATAVPVSGTVAVTGTQSDAITDAQLRATALPVSGTVAVTGTQDDALTDTQLRASRVPVTLNAPTVIDANNSFDDLTLTANEVLTGTWTDILDYTSLSIVLRASQVSATGGAVIEFSDDSTSPSIRTLTATVIGTVVGGLPIYVSLPVQAQYFRLIYTNGATGGTLDAQTLLKRMADSPAAAPLGSSLDLFSSAQVTRAVLAGQSDGSTIENISVDDDAFLRVNLAGQDIPIDIAPLAASQFTQVNARTLVNGGPTKLISTTLTSRSSIAVKNPSATRVVYIGTNPSLTQTSSSFPLGAGETITLDLDSSTDLYGLADDTDTAVDVRVAVVEVG